MKSKIEWENDRKLCRLADMPTDRSHFYRKDASGDCDLFIELLVWGPLLNLGKLAWNVVTDFAQWISTTVNRPSKTWWWVNGLPLVLCLGRCSV